MHEEKDFSLSGALIILGVFVVIVLVVYLISIQKRSENCVQTVKTDGTVVTECRPSVPEASISGQVQLLDNLQPKEDEVNKTLQNQIPQ